MASSHQKGNDHSKSISNSPHFFKIILQHTIQEGKLGIPRKFVKKYGNGMSSPALLRVPTGAVWKVELTKCDGKIWLKNGWQEFSNHYSLEFGHILVFRYEGNCNFKVFIFDRSTSEIEYPCTSNNLGRSQEILESNIEESEDDDSIQIIEDISPSPSRKTREKSSLPCPRPHKMMKSSDSAFKTESNVKSETLAPQFGHNGCRRIQQFKAGKKAMALQRAASAFKSENPFFLVVMQPSYVNLGKKCRLSIPTNFVREHLMKDHCNVILCNSNGKTWTVSYCREKKLYASLRTGWGTFVQENNIHVGDVCSFELVNCIDISFKVVVYPNQNANCNELSALHEVFRPPNPVKKIVRASNPRQRCLKQLNAAEKSKAFQKARAFTSENPFFVIVLQPTYVQKNNLSIPENFARKYFTKTFKDVVLRLSNGKSWPVKYYQQGFERPRARLYTGWLKFARENSLERGDVCIFELTEGTETSFKVTIYKNQAVEDESLGSSLADRSTENQVELHESSMIKTESDRVNDKGDMSTLHNQHPTKESPVQTLQEIKAIQDTDLRD